MTINAETVYWLVPLLQVILFALRLKIWSVDGDASNLRRDSVMLVVVGAVAMMTLLTDQGAFARDALGITVRDSEEASPTSEPPTDTTTVDGATSGAAP